MSSNLVKLVNAFSGVKRRIRKLPEPIRLGISYILFYLTGIGEITHFLGSWLKVSDSVLQLITRDAAVVFLLHWALVTAAWVLRKFWNPPDWPSKPRLLGATLLVAFVIGALTTIPTLVRRGPVTIIDDKERLGIATQVIPEFEKEVVSGVAGSLGQARGKLDDFSEHLRRAQRTGHDLVAYFQGYQEDLRAHPSSGYGYLVVYVPSGRPDENPLVAPEFSTEVPKELVKHARLRIKSCSVNQGITQWLTWTPFGHLAVAACEDKELGMLIAATLWDEGSFLKSTQTLWDTKGFDLSLVQDGKQITYTTEISIYGDRRKESTEHLKMRRVTEVRYKGHVQYAYQDQAKDQILFPDLSFRLRFPDTPKPTTWQIVISIVVFLVGLILIVIVAGKDLLVDVDESAPEQP